MPDPADAANRAREAADVARRAAIERRREVARERARAQAGDVKLYGDNGYVSIAAGSKPPLLPIFTYRAESTLGPVSISIEPTGPGGNGFTVSNRVTAVALQVPDVDSTALRQLTARLGLASPSEAAISRVRKQLSERVSNTNRERIEVRFTPPEDWADDTAYQLIIKAQSAGKTKTLTLHITISPPEPPTGYLQRFQRTGNFSWVNVSLAGYAIALVDDVSTQSVEQAGGFAAKPREIGDRGKDITGYVATNNRVVLVVVRGTNPFNLENWGTNFSFLMVGDERYCTEPSAEMHIGFRNAADEIWPSLTEALEEIQERFDDMVLPIWVIGFSLGGAVGSLLASRLDIEGHRVQGVITMGAPYFANKQFKEDYEARLGNTGRIVNGLDPVPRLLAAVPPPYVPIGDGYYIDNDELHTMRRAADNDQRMGEDTAAIILQLGALGLLSPLAAGAAFTAMAFDWHDNIEYWRHVFDNGVDHRMDIAGLPLPGIDTD